jgi:Cd2+/Zn2+-exporting ATPase
VLFHLQLGNALEVVHADLLPEGKVKIISEFKREGRTAMLGDGINDAPALALADIGISMGISGSALATETGDIILMSNDLRKIPEVIKLARESRRKVIENIILSVITKVAILALAIAGHPIVWAAVLADVGTCLLVILNSMLLLRKRHKHGEQSCKSSTHHIHKIGCDDTNCGSSHQHPHQHQHHSHKHCCSEKAEPKKCASNQQFTKHCHSNHGREHMHDHGTIHDIHNKKSGCHSDFKEHETDEISIDIITEHIESSSKHGCSSEIFPVECGSCEVLNEKEVSSCCKNECSSIMHA